MECPEDKKVTQDNHGKSVRVLSQEDHIYEDCNSGITVEDTTIPKAVNRPIWQATLVAKKKLKEWLNLSNQISLWSVTICIASYV